MPTPAFQTLIFDLDGTLIDSSASILAGFAAALEEEGLSATCPLAPEIIGPPLKQTLAHIAGSDDSALIERLANHFKAYYDSEGFKATTVFPGIDTLLPALQAAGCTLHIATNKRLTPTLRILDHLGWTHHFQTVYALDKVSPAFPDKRSMIAGQLAREGIPRHQAAYVGDRPEDGQAADANQLPFFAATWGYSALATQALAHWRLIDSPMALIQHLRGVDA